MKSSDLWIVGTGPMAVEYVPILIDLGESFTVIGRGKGSADAFFAKTGIATKVGGLRRALEDYGPPKNAIVAVGIEDLVDTAKLLLKAGTTNILLEKPGALSLDDIASLGDLSEKTDALVVVGYNRRFFQAIIEARKIINRDGGLQSISFDFTEWDHVIRPLKKPKKVKDLWVISNSSHVIDLAFSIAGEPLDWNCWTSGSLDWHPTASRFCGGGMTDKGVMFSYLSDWQAPGRWGLELMTRKSRLILRPMETLKKIKLGSSQIETIKLSSDLDTKYKPGLFEQTKAFLSEDRSLSCTLAEQARNLKIYQQMANYK